MAIQDAISWLDETDFEDGISNSDSLSSVQALESFNANDYLIATIIKMIQKTKYKIFINWVRDTRRLRVTRSWTHWQKSQLKT